LTKAAESDWMTDRSLEAISRKTFWPYPSEAGEAAKDGQVAGVRFNL
jgi:hypothetical protein